MDTYHRWMEVTIYATFAGLPAISVPAGFSADRPADGAAADRPPARRSGTLLQLAQAYEQAAQDVLQVSPR